MTKHAIFITIDALKFDVLSDIASSKFLFLKIVEEEMLI